MEINQDLNEYQKGEIIQCPNPICGIDLFKFNRNVASERGLVYHDIDSLCGIEPSTLEGKELRCMECSTRFGESTMIGFSVHLKNYGWCR